MTDLKDQWDLEMALAAVAQETIDSEPWADAAKWLLFYGPPEIQELLQQASTRAIQQCFPDLKFNSFTKEGKPCYTLKQLAAALGISKAEALEKIQKFEREQGEQQLFSDADIQKIQ
jgi:hypothetical protein